MKKVGLVLVVLIILAMASVALADCAGDCSDNFSTCMNICSQTTEEGSSAFTKCTLRCLRGVNGCLKRCGDKKSEAEEFTFYAQIPIPGTPVKVKECVEWKTKIIKVHYKCGTKWITKRDPWNNEVSVEIDIMCTKDEESVICTKWVDVAQ